MIIHDEEGKPISADTSHVSLDIQNLATTTGYMLVDLSNTTNWKHHKTNHIELRYISINVNPASAFRGDVSLGFLSNVDASNGDFNVIKTWHLDQAGLEIVSNIDFSLHGFSCTTDHHFGPITTNDTTWQTDVNLEGPDGNTSYPAGNGDLALKVTRTAGNTDVNIFVSYITR